MNAVHKAARVVGKLSNKLRRRLDVVSSSASFSGSQGRTLHFLLAQSEPVFQKDIEEEFGIRSSTATELLKQMEQKGLIRRSPLETDKRCKEIVLTDSALVYQKQVSESLDQLERDLTQGISQEDLDVFYRVTEQMIQNLTS